MFFAEHGEEGEWVIGMWQKREEDKKIALRIVFIYIAISIVWVLLSDWLLKDYLIAIEWLGTVKGWVFIIITGLLFYKLIQKEIKNTMETEAKYRIIVENVSDLIVVLDTNGELKYASPSHQTILGFFPKEIEGKQGADFINSVDISKMKNSFREIMSMKQRKLIEFKLKHKKGHYVLVEGKSIPILNEDGTVGSIVIFAHDITERNHAEKQLIDSEERYRKLVEFSPETILIHINGEIVYINNAGVKLTGVDDMQQIIGKHFYEFISKEDIEYINERKKLTEDEQSMLYELSIVRPDGIHIDVETLAFETTYQGEKATQVILRDITRRKKAEEKINHFAYYDALTGLPNRNYLYRYLKESMERTKERSQMMAVMFLDLDRFKMINDAFGHSFGDVLLQQVSNRLQECLGNEGIVARYGGDEYIIVFEHQKTDDVPQLAEQILHKFSIPFTIQDRQTYISPSIGISVYPTDGDDVDLLIKNADTAMYFAKESCRNNYQFYRSSLNSSNSRKMELENGLRNAIENNEFMLYYQPQVNLISNQIIGLEALIRWKHPEYGFVSPTEFIPIAEETGLIVTFGQWVLHQACQQNKRWQDQGFPPVRIAVNVSAVQFRNIYFIDVVKQVLQDTKLDPAYLELEITESVMQHVEDTTSIMMELKGLGVHLAMDDFGKGFSSLNYLRNFPIDKLKIDKSFVDEINVRLNGEIIVNTIINLGNSLGFEVIAEGIVNDQQKSFLLQNNCHLGQGYLFSKPVPAEEIERILSRMDGIFVSK